MVISGQSPALQTNLNDRRQPTTAWNWRDVLEGNTKNSLLLNYVTKETIKPFARKWPTREMMMIGTQSGDSAVRLHTATPLTQRVEF